MCVRELRGCHCFCHRYPGVKHCIPCCRGEEKKSEPLDLENGSVLAEVPAQELAVGTVRLAGSGVPPGV